MLITARNTAICVNAFQKFTLWIEIIEAGIRYETHRNHYDQSKSAKGNMHDCRMNHLKSTLINYLVEQLQQQQDDEQYQHVEEVQLPHQQESVPLQQQQQQEEVIQNNLHNTTQIA